MHKFEHLPHKKWLSCKLCFTSFSLTKDIIRHLGDIHHLKADRRTGNNADIDDESQEPFGYVGDDYDEGAGAADTKKLLAGFEGFMSKKEERDAFEKHIDYLCPECGKEFNDKKPWRKHMVDVHQLGDIETLNFEMINERQLRCRECDKIITNAYGIQNAQQHRITHMKFKSFAICRICRKQYTDRKGLMKHLKSSHGVGVIGNTSLRKIPSPIPNIGSAVVPIKTKPYKEIVRHQNYTYEICYLEDDDNEHDFGRGCSSSSSTAAPYDFAKGDAHLYRSSYAGPKHNLEQLSRHRCVDCGSGFASKQSLQYHIKTEHEFVDYSPSTTMRNSPKLGYNTNAEEKSNDTDNLLVSSGREVQFVKSDDNNASDINFIYICPQCGIEFRLRHLWRCHINMEHNFDQRDALDFRIVEKFRYECLTCHEMVQSSKLKGLQDHKFRHCPYKQYLKCLICGQAYNHKPNMIRHLRQRHNITDAEPPSVAMENRLQLNKSKQLSKSNISKTGINNGGNISKAVGEIKTKPPEVSASAVNTDNSRPPILKTMEDVISSHNAVDHESITYHCPSCTKTFDSHVYWRKHIVDEHNLNSREGLNFRQLDDHHYICLQCYKRVTVTHTKGAIGQLQSHKFRHLPYKSFHCTACKGQFVRKQMFFKHLDKITNKCLGIMSNDTTMNDGMDLNDSTQFGDEFAAGDNTMTENDSSATKDIWPTHNSLPAQASTYENPSENQGCFTLSCPQCGIEFETTRAWREHINIEHNLNCRNVLNFRKINSKLHLCLECNETVNGRKLRSLQAHKFKHLPFGAYLHCRFCSMNYHHISNMQEHLKNKHPQMLQIVKPPHGSMDMDEDDGATGNIEDVDGGGDGDGDGDGAEIETVDSPPDLEDVVDIDLLEAEAEIEEVDPDNVESDDQYLLG